MAITSDKHNERIANMTFASAPPQAPMKNSPMPTITLTPMLARTGIHPQGLLYNNNTMPNAAKNL